MGTSEQALGNASGARNLTVLLVDDEPDVRRIAQVALTRLDGMRVVEAEGAASGLELAAREKPDVILMDVMMPGTNGIEAMHALRRDPTTASIPVVFLTAKATSADKLMLEGLGARGVVTKPFDPTTLGAQLRSFLK